MSAASHTHILFPDGFVERVAAAMQENGWSDLGDYEDFLDDLKSAFAVAEAEWAIAQATQP